jgi:predicted nucleic acid-binding protein
MPTIVVDANLIFRFLLPNPQQQLIRTTVNRWLQTDVRLVAPMLWLYELTSAVAKSLQAGELTEEESRRLIGLIHTFPIDLIAQDHTLSLAALTWSRRLRRANAYDSAYLALAEALHAELWTVDQRLINAARQPWLHTIVAPDS